jgi:hypothetical protein
MRPPVLLVAALLAAPLLACSGSLETLAGDGGPGGTGDAGGRPDGGVVDGGWNDSGCPPPAPMPACSDGCGGVLPGPSCVDGRWQCPQPPEIECQVDAGTLDASFACGAALTCNAATQYCQNDNGGVPLLDGGSNSSWACQSFPATCDGGAPHSCGCLVPVSTSGCFCNAADGGAVTVTCDFP